MTVNLTKGGNINLTKDNAGLSKIFIGLGWDANKMVGSDFDLDASAAALDSAGKLADDNNFVFFNNLSDVSSAIKHGGDNLTGEGSGDDEKIFVDLQKVASTVEKISFAVSIYQAAERHQNFGIVTNAYIRVVDESNGKELARYDLAEDFSLETTVIFGELYQNNGDWKFKAIGAGIQGEIRELINFYK